MRFGAQFIDLVRTQRCEPEGRTWQILKELAEYRRTHQLDEKFPPDDHCDLNDRVCLSELHKVATIFESMRSVVSDSDRALMAEVLKEDYSAEEIGRVVSEYFGTEPVPII